MTLPFMNWDDVTPDDVVETVVMPDQLGSALQDQSETHYAGQSADRFPGYVDGTLAGGPLASGPLGSVNKMYGKFVSKVAKADPATIEKPKDLQPLVPGFFDLPLLDLFAPLLQALMGLGGGVFGNALGGIADLFSGKWDQMDSQGEQLNALAADQESMTQSTAKATAYMASSPGTTTSPTRMPFTAATGHVPKNVQNLGDGRWKLLLAGEHDITAQVEFYGGALMPPQTYMQIIMRMPDGSVREGVLAKASTTDDVTLTNVTTVEAPVPGCTVEVLAWTGKIPLLGGSFRGIRGGYATTRLMIRKFDLETSD